MDTLNTLFRQRIGFSAEEPITFENLGSVLEKTAKSLPFENLRIITGRTREITKENLIDKILLHQEGGLCYELNPLLYYFLLDNGMDVSLVGGVVYSQGEWSSTGRTHTSIILTHKGEQYLIDTGFGGNLPLLPVSLSGETIYSATGAFRVEKKDSEYGDYLLMMKLKHKDLDWKIGYAFDTRYSIGKKELDQMQQIIEDHPDSPFNKQPLLTMRTEQGQKTLTDHTYTVTVNGEVTKETIDERRFQELKKQFLGR